MVEDKINYEKIKDFERNFKTNFGKCPFLNKKCIKEDCEIYSDLDVQCSISVIASILRTNYFDKMKEE
jgi:Fe-S-cluster containining protein